jgi:hypothetical protein
MIMEYDKVKELLRRYYEGLTTEAEERQLRELLSDPVILSRFPGEKHLAYLSATVPEPSEGFYERLADVTQRELNMSPRHRLLRHAATVAAAAVILAASWMLLNQYGPQAVKDTYTDPAIAMAEVKSILTEVSRKMNTGMEELEPMRKITEAPEAVGEMSRINSIVEDNLAKLRYLSRIDNGNGPN